MATQGPHTNSTLSYTFQGKLKQAVSRITNVANVNRILNIGYAGNGVDVTGSYANAFQNGITYNQGLGSAANYYNHQPLTVTDAVRNRTDMTYTAWGAPLTVTTFDRNNQQLDQVRYVYGTQSGPNLNRVIEVRLDTTLQASYSYDTSGRVVSMGDARGLVVNYAYNALDKVTRTTYPDGTFEAVTYDCCSLPGSVTDRSGRITSYGYDKLKRLIRVQDADAKTLDFGYDKEGNRISLRDARGALTQWQYDGDGRATVKTYADGTTERWNYNPLDGRPPDGRLVSSTNARNQTTSYGYSLWDEISNINYPTTTAVSFNRDGFGRVTDMSDASGNTRWVYDNAGRPSIEDGPWYGDDVQHYYDSRNNVRRMEVGSNVGKDAVNYGYDIIGRLSQVSAATGKWGAISGARGGTWDTTYVGWSQMPLTSNAPNGMYHEWNYEGYGSLQRLLTVSNKISASSGVLSRFYYGYNSTVTATNALDTRNGVGKQYGNFAGQTQGVTYSYNTTSMLTKEDGGTAGNASTPQLYKTYGYDPMGNRTGFSDYYANQLTGTSTYNNLNEITRTTLNTNRVTDYNYDSDGNTTGAYTSTPGLSAPGSGTIYTYDEANRLTSIAFKSNLQLATPNSRYEFVYDGMSRLRISRYYARDINNILTLQNETRRVYDGMDVVQERDAGNTVTASYTRTGNIGGILARTTSAGPAGTVFYGYDGGGNVTTLTNNAGAEVGSYTYDAWGNTVATSGGTANENPYRFSTKESFGGLYSYGLRFYSPGLGRWINRDPIGEAGGTNLYGFVGNDPVNVFDLYGLWPKPGDPDYDPTFHPFRGAPASTTSAYAQPRDPQLFDRTFDFAVFSTSFPIPNPVTKQFVGISCQAAQGRYGRYYFGIGPAVGVSKYPISGSLTASWILQNEQPSPEELSGFLSGPFGNAGGGYIFGGGITKSGSKQSLDLGLYTPQLGGAVTNYWQLNNP